MASHSPISLVGGTASPYTNKMVALLRYRHIPYSITWGDPGQFLDALGVEKPKPVFMPTCLFEEQRVTKAVCDSTPIIRRLESMYDGRSVLPTDPAQRKARLWDIFKEKRAVQAFGVLALIPVMHGTAADLVV